MKQLSIAFEIILIAAIAFIGYKIVTDKLAIKESKHSAFIRYEKLKQLTAADIGTGNQLGLVATNGGCGGIIGTVMIGSGGSGGVTNVLKIKKNK